MNKFNKFFKNLEKEFNDLNSLKEIRNSDHKIHWREGYGVYTLWNKEIDFKNLSILNNKISFEIKNSSQKDLVINIINFNIWIYFNTCDSHNHKT